MKGTNERSRAYYVLWLLTTKSIGQAKARQIIEVCKNNNISLENLYDKVNNGGLLPSYLMNYSEVLKNKDERLDNQWEILLEKHIKSVIYDEEKYPKRLLAALGNKSPVVLFFEGDIEILQKLSIGFCGSRNASKKGLETAKDCAGQMASEGANIISGYAQGIDLATHIAALEAGGVTTLVLAEGIMNFKVRKELSKSYNPSKTLVISEFLPGVPWSVRNAMQRNSTICGLSNLTVLIEAQEKGGSLNAGKKCLSMGRPLFAPVYLGMPESAIGNRILLKQGALELMRDKKTGKAHMSKIREILFGDNNQDYNDKKNININNSLVYKNLFD